MMFTVKRIPLGLEKLYSRTILIFLLVNGLSMAQLFKKYFWIFLATIMAMEGISRFSSAVAGYTYGETSEEAAGIND